MSDYISNFRKGETKLIKFEFNDSNGNGIDVSNWAFTLSLKKDYNSDTPDYTFNYTAGANVDDDIFSGLTYFTIDSTANTIIPDQYYWSLSVNKGGTPNIIEYLLPDADNWKDRLIVLDPIT